MKMRDFIRTVVLKTNPYGPFWALNKTPYFLAIRAFLRLCKDFPQILSVYLRAGLAEGHWVPGLSDIDLTVIIDSQLSLEQEFLFLRSFWKRCDRMKNFFPMLGEVEILNNEQLGTWTKFGVPGYKAPSWRLVYGTEVRRCNYIPDPTRLTQDSLNFALWFYLRYFLEIFSLQEKCPYLVSQDLKRLESKILRCLDTTTHPEPAKQRVFAPLSNKVDMLYQILNALEEKICHFNANDISIKNGEWLPGLESNNHLFYETPLLDFRELACLNGAIESVMLNFHNRVFIVLKTALDAPTLKNCMETMRRVFSDEHETPIIVSSSIFSYILRYYDPFEYAHFISYRRVVFGEDLLSNIQPPSRSSFIDYLLGQVRNILTFPRSHAVILSSSPTLFRGRQLESMVERCLFLKLYLEKGVVNPWHNQLLGDCQKHYPEDYKKLRDLTARDERSSQQWFGLLKSLSNDIHDFLANSS